MSKEERNSKKEERRIALVRKEERRVGVGRVSAGREKNGMATAGARVFSSLMETHFSHTPAPRPAPNLHYSLSYSLFHSVTQSGALTLSTFNNATRYCVHAWSSQL